MIVLDTHIWLWWIAGDSRLLTEQRIEAINTEDEVAISAISCFEAAWLERHGRISFPCSREIWFQMALDGSGIKIIPITPEISGIAVDLPYHHNDPQDRLIIATSIAHNSHLMSSDKKFSMYQELENKLI